MVKTLKNVNSFSVTIWIPRNIKPEVHKSDCKKLQRYSGQNVFIISAFFLIFTFFFSSCDSVDKLRSKLPSLEKEIQDANKFKEFYQFTFNYAKNAGQKGLDLDMALAYWNIVLKGKFRFLDVWTKFLKVNILLNYYIEITFFLLITAKVI